MQNHHRFVVNLIFSLLTLTMITLCSSGCSQDEKTPEADAKPEKFVAKSPEHLAENFLPATVKGDRIALAEMLISPWDRILPGLEPEFQNVEQALKELIATADEKFGVDIMQMRPLREDPDIEKIRKYLRVEIEKKDPPNKDGVVVLYVRYIIDLPPELIDPKKKGSPEREMRHWVVQQKGVWRIQDEGFSFESIFQYRIIGQWIESGCGEILPVRGNKSIHQIPSDEIDARIKDTKLSIGELTAALKATTEDVKEGKYDTAEELTKHLRGFSNLAYSISKKYEKNYDNPLKDPCHEILWQEWATREMSGHANNKPSKKNVIKVVVTSDKKTRKVSISVQEQEPMTVEQFTKWIKEGKEPIRIFADNNVRFDMISKILEAAKGHRKVVLDVGKHD